MNRLHRWYCQSRRWKHKLESEILPWSLNGIDLGGEVLEIGPGPGLATEWLRDRCSGLTCLEIDPILAGTLALRMANSRVKVLAGDATTMPFHDGQFSAVVSFTMLHHVASSVLQDRLFAETYRVLKPGGVFAGVDSRWSLKMRLFHLGDTMVTINPAKLHARLEAVNFGAVAVEASIARFRFSALRLRQRISLPRLCSR
jgi:SAM-dependent methyltransferase